jgi:uncharacterized phiE125 gp8 family phage protein
MSLSLVTAPATEPLTLAEVRAHLRVTVADEDDLLASLIVAAREYAETFTHRAFLAQTWDLQLDGFPQCFSTLDGAGSIWVPKAPLVSVTSLSYVDTAGVTQVWPASNFTVDAPVGPKARPGRLTPAYAVYYPVTRRVPNAVTVRFVAGYGTAAAAVPASIKAAMKLLIGNWWINRDAAALVRASADVLPFGVDALLWPYKAL